MGAREAASAFGATLTGAAAMMFERGPLSPSDPFVVWSGRRGSNPRHSAWKADALPTELLPHRICQFRAQSERLTES